ncbi:MAG: metallophosphoesterase [Myxococcota bacterium]
MGALIIGDIHGCYDELRDLLGAAGLTDDDEIIALGDMIDRGPQNEAVLRFFRDHPNARSIRGNHEHKHVAIRDDKTRPALSQQITRRDMGGQLQPFFRWMAGLPISLQLDDALLTHGFFEPGVSLDKQQPDVLMGLLNGERHLQTARSRPWYEDVDHATPIIVGHRDYHRNGQPLAYRDRVFGLDTTVYGGGRLTGLLLPAFRFVSVPARGDHWTRAREQNADLRYRQTPLDKLTWERARMVMAAYRLHPPRSVYHRRRQQRLSAMMFAAEKTRDALMRDLRQTLEDHQMLSADDFAEKFHDHPYQSTLARWRRSGAVDSADLERCFRRPAELLRADCAE